MLGLVFAGSPAKLAEGVRIAGVDVGGLTPRRAERLLERRAAARAQVPVFFTDGTRRFGIRPSQLGIAVDWRAAVDSARRDGEGFGPVRGFRRLKFRLFPADVTPPTRAYAGALDYKVSLLARAIDREPTAASIVRRGLHFHLLPGRNGQTLDRDAAAETIVRSLASFGRGNRVPLPMQVEAPKVTAPDLQAALARARRAVSAPVRLSLGDTRWLVPRWRIAQLLELPRDGRTRLAIGGPAADTWFRGLAARVDRPPHDASFVVNGGSVGVLPSRPGTGLDVAASTEALLGSPKKGRVPLSVDTTTFP